MTGVGLIVVVLLVAWVAEPLVRRSSRGAS